MMKMRVALAAAFLAAGFAWGAETVGFSQARPVWAAGREKEVNLSLRFTADFSMTPRQRGVVVRATGCSVYRIRVNGAFAGYGPARGPKGFDRVDEWDVTRWAKKGAANTVEIDVGGFNCPNYYLIDQPSYLQAEIVVDGWVVAATSAGPEAGCRGFAACALDREQKVPRYSFQRPFVEVWNEPFAAGETLLLAEQPQKALLPRRAAYPDFALNATAKKIAEGRARYDSAAPVRSYWSLTEASPTNDVYRGWTTNEMAVVPVWEAQRYVADAKGTVRTATYDFGLLDCGFVGCSVKAKGPGRVLVVFDEILTGGKIDFLRGGTGNVLVWNLKAAGEHALESFEPYAFRYAKFILDGDMELESPFIRTYKCPTADAKACPTDDPELKKIFEAARETFRQNAVDVFTDCPGRERAGWLCDSYFTSRASQMFTGDLKLEELFLENFLLGEESHIPKGMFPMCYPSDHPNRNFIPNWAMWLVLELEDYLRRGGDPALVKRFEPKVTALVDYLLQFENADGLLEKLPAWVFVEWSAANSFTQDVNYPSNMTWARVLDAVGALYGRRDLVDKAARVRETVRRQSFDGTWFRDNAVRGKDGRLAVTTNHTETCQYYAFFFGTATRASHPKLWKTLVEEFGPQRKQTKAYPDVPFSNAFIGNYLRLELLSEAGLDAAVEENVRGYFLKMAETTGTLWEHDAPTASCCHGFASYVAVLIDRLVSAKAKTGVTPVVWEKSLFDVPPAVYPSGFPASNGVTSIFYDGVPYQGRATRVFAYLAMPKVAPGKKVPGMVLVHGGLGSAFRRWAKFWSDQGYAAIAMDTCGCVSGNEHGDEQRGHRRHAWAGPQGWGDFANVDKPVGDQWSYHAVAAVIRANTLLRSLPEVDPARIGITGVSWGGYLTCMAASVDPRFNFAAPVYGCGYLDENSVWKTNHGESGATDAQFRRWCALFDPRHYLARAKCDFLWIDGSNDFAYPLDSLQKSVETLKTAWYRATRLRMPHGHGAYAEHPQELVDFANFRLKKDGRTTYPFVRSAVENGGVVALEWQADEDRIVRAELNWTADRGDWQKREWKAIPMKLYEGYASAEADLPSEATTWYANAFTADGKCVSGELVQRSDADIAALKALRARQAVEPSLAPLPQGLAASADFTVSPGKVRRELHGSSWVTRSYPRGFNNDDKTIAALKLDSFRTHDAPLVNSGQNIVDTHEIFPLMHLDAKDPRNYVFEPTDHFLELNFNLGMKCLYRLGTSIEHTGEWGYNTRNPKDHDQYAEVLAGIVRHYTKGWANGYRWSDRITHWELFNEPDVDPCWRGTREEFIHLYVTCLKRLKAEFPELTIGGPGFGSFFTFGRELLAACRAANVKPDFVAWHYYGSNPQNILAQPAQVKAMAAEEGFPELELIIDEWHYIRNNSWDGIQGATSPEAMRRAREGSEGVNGIDSAVFTTQVELGFHDTPLSKSHFYGCGYDGCWGYVDRYRRPNKVYHAMQAMGELIAACRDRATCRAACRTFGAFGAWESDRKGARLIVSDFRGESKELSVAVKGISPEAKVSVRRMDDGHDWEPASAEWHDGRLTLPKVAPGSVIFDIRFSL